MSLAIPIEATVAPGQTITSAWANAGVRDGVNFAINPPMAEMYQITTQSIGNGAVAAVTFDGTLAGSDTYGGHSNTVNPSRYTCQIAGWYLVKAGVVWAASATGNRTVQIYKNGTAWPYSWLALTTAGTFNDAGVETSTLVQLAVGDYVEAWAGQNAGGGLSTAVVSTIASNMFVLWKHA